MDGSLLGWLAVLRSLAALPAPRVMPGHGPASAAWPGAMEPQQRYLSTLRDDIRQSLSQGQSLAQAVQNLAPPADGWLLAEDNHQRNVTTGYTELEWE